MNENESKAGTSRTGTSYAKYCDIVCIDDDDESSEEDMPQAFCLPMTDDDGTLDMAEHK